LKQIAAFKHIVTSPGKHLALVHLPDSHAAVMKAVVGDQSLDMIFFFPNDRHDVVMVDGNKLF
jgi:hypothetical protein